MASVKFYIKDSKSEKTNIYFFLNYGAYEIVGGKKKYTPLKYYINESINAKYWNAKIGRAKQDSRFKQYPEFNARLQNIEDDALNLIRRLQNDKVDITHDLLRKELDSILKPEKKQTEDTVMEFMDFFSYYMKISGNSKGTLKSYQQVEKVLKEYESENNIKLTFNKIDVDFHNRFVLWLRETRNFAPNTIGVRIKVIKTVMRASHDRGLHNNTDYQKKAFSKPQEATTAVYLNENELTKLYNLDLSDNKKLDNVRDWFLIASYTGLRFSDFSRLTKENIKNDTITIQTQKTGATVVIPFHTVVRAILDKHEYKLPKVISNQKFNEYVKQVCKLAEINESIMLEETKGKMKITRSEKKYNLVSAHTARRSFATNAFLAGVPTIQIMKITSHRSEKIFLNYIKISEKENADKLKLHPFFNKMIVK